MLNHVARRPSRTCSVAPLKTIVPPLPTASAVTTRCEPVLLRSWPRVTTQMVCSVPPGL